MLTCCELVDKQRAARSIHANVAGMRAQHKDELTSKGIMRKYPYGQ
jgi:hypothetical protein